MSLLSDKINIGNKCPLNHATVVKKTQNTIPEKIC